MDIPVRLVLVGPPKGVAFGIQQGRGDGSEAVSVQQSRGGDLIFELSLTLKSADDSPLNLTGPFAQGPKGDRFIYIGVGTFAGQKDSCWSRRIKIPLKGISKTQVREVLSKPRHALVVRIPGTGRDGTPSCATVKPLDDWKVMKS